VTRYGVLQRLIVLDLISAFLAAIRVFFRSRVDTSLEVLALRQQVAVLKRKRPRPSLNRLDRFFWTTLRNIRSFALTSRLCRAMHVRRGLFTWKRSSCGFSGRSNLAITLMAGKCAGWAVGTSAASCSWLW
jgi:hypothetical protein